MKNIYLAVISICLFFTVSSVMAGLPGDTICTGDKVTHPLISHIPYPGCPSAGQNGTVGSPDHQGKDNCEKVCKFSIITYFTAVHPGSTYFWKATGDVTITGINTNTVVVHWDATPFGSLTVYETNHWGCVDSNKICVEKLDLPIANFSFPASACKLAQVQFNNLSAGAISYQWFFGDGGTSNATDPLHVYNSGGIFTITLIATNSCHCTDTLKKTINVSSLPGPDISCPSTVCAHDNATYSTSVSGCVYHWFVQGGIIVGPFNQQSVNISWGPGQMGAVGLYLSGCASVCTDTTWVAIPIIPAVAIIAGPSKVCPGDCADFSIPDFSGATYHWSLNSGSCGSIKDTSECGKVEICYPAFGYPCNDTLKVTYYDNHLHCGGSGIKIIHFRPKLDIFGPAEVCVKNLASFFAASGVSCTWKISPVGPVFSPGPGSSVTFNWMNLPGTYIITAFPQNPNQVCNDSASFSVTVLPAPAKPVITGDTLLCPNSVGQYCATASGNISWVIVGGTPANGSGNCITVNWGATPPFRVKAVNAMTSSPFCPSDTTTLKVNVITPAPMPVITGSHTACANLTQGYACNVVMPAGSTFSWTLNPPNAGAITIGQNTNAVQIEWGNNAPQTIILSLSVTVCNTTVTDTFHISLNPVPLPVAYQVGNLCQGGSAQLAVSGGVFTAWQWSGPGSFSSSLASPTINVQGLYQVTATAGGCPGISQINVTYVGSPLASISAQGPLVYCIGTPFSVNLCALGNGNYSYQWSGGGPGTQCYTVSAPGSWVVTVTDNSNGCFAISNSLSVSTIPCAGGNCTPNGSAGFTHASCNPVVFTNTSVNASSFFWDFGDNTSSIATNPTHTYNQAGFYLVTLTATVPDASGTGFCTVKDTALIEVPLVAKFDILPACFGLPVCFTDKSVHTVGNSIASWNWNFGDASSSGTQNPCHTYALPGTYVVTLTISNANCTTSHSDTVIVRAKPTAAFSFSNNACVNSAVLFTDNSFSNINYWNWNFGNAGTSLNQNPSESYATSGLFPVTLTVHDKYGCVASVIHNITVNAPMASGNIAAFPDTIVCAGTTVLLLAPPCAGCSYVWNTAATNDSITVTQTGVYTVTITDANGCKYSTHIKIVVLQNPQATITSNKNKLCLGEYALLSVQYNPKWTYAWISNDASVNGNTNATVSAFPALVGNYFYKVVINDTVTGCSDTTFAFILHVYMPPVAPLITALGPTTVCKGDTIVLKATHPNPSVNFKWNTGEITTTIKVSKSGCYSVVATDTNGCNSSATYCVTVNPLPSLCSYYEGCFDTCAPFLIKGPPGNTSYQWYMNGLPIAGANAQNYLANVSGTYSLAVTNSFGCSDTTGNLNLTLYKCPDSLCAKFVIDTVFCIENGHYIMHYHVTNLSMIPINEVSLQVLPPNLTVAAAPSLVIQNIPSAATSSQLTATLFNGVAGSKLCFRTHVFAYDSVGNEIMCCISDTVCVILPPCPPEPCSWAGAPAAISVAGNVLLASPSGLTYQWYTSPPSLGTLIPGATSQFYTPSTTGNYCVVITKALHCTDTACIFHEVPDTGCCYLHFSCDSIWCVYNANGTKEYHFKLEVLACGTLSITANTAGGLSVPYPMIFPGGTNYIIGTYTTPTDSLMCLTFLMGNGIFYCKDTTICFALPHCPPPPLPCNWQVTPSLCVGSTAAFQYNGIMQPGTTYSWMFPGGIPASASGPGPHYVNYPVAGSYSVILTMSNPYGYTLCTEVILVSAKPAAAIQQTGNILLAVPNNMLYQWYFGSPSAATAIPEAHSQYYVPTQNGSYCVAVLNNIGCGDTACIDYAALGIPNLSLGKTNISLNPNPTSGDINIQILGDYENINIEITNLTGQLVNRKSSEKANLLQMSIDGPSGLYFVTARNDKGEMVVFKVVKR